MAGPTTSPSDMQVQVRFETRLPERFRIPTSTFSVPATLNRYGLSEVINTLLGMNEKPQAFDFVIQGQLLRSSLYKALLEHGLSTETAVVVEYTLAALPPSPGAVVAHEDWVSAVCCSVSLGAVATGSYDHTARLFSPLSLHLGPKGAKTDEGDAVAVPRPMVEVQGHSGPVSAAALAPYVPSGEEQQPSMLLVTGSKDMTARLWRLSAAPGSAPGAAVAAGDSDPVTAKWLEPRAEAVLRGHRGAVLGADVSSGGQAGGERKVATASWDCAIRLWSLSACCSAAAPEAGQGEDAAASVPGDDDAKGGQKRRRPGAQTGGQAQEVDAEATLQGHTGGVSSVFFTDARGAGVEWEEPCGLGGGSGSHLVSGSWDHSIRFWDVEHLATVHTITSAHPVFSVSPGGGDACGLVAVGAANATLRIWDLRARSSTAPALQLASHRSWISCVKWCPGDSKLLLSASYDGTVKFWDARSTVPLHSVNAHPGHKVLAADWWGSTAAVSGGSDSRLRCFLTSHTQSPSA